MGGIWVKITLLTIAMVMTIYIYKYIQIEECPRGVAWEKYSQNKSPNQQVKIKKRSSPKGSGYPQRIPLYIHQTNERESIPKGMADAIKSIRKINPEYEHNYYDNNDSRAFIHKYLGSRVLKAYDTLIPGAYKADLFRYCVLYIKGGVYLDTCFVGVKPLREIIDPQDKFISATDHMGGRKDIYNAFMCCTPQHPIIKAALDISLDRIERKDKGYNPLYITGPIALREAFYSIIGLTPEEREYPGNVKLYRFKNGRKCISGIIRANGEIVFYTKYPNYKNDMKWYATDEHYSSLWEKNKIFRE